MLRILSNHIILRLKYLNKDKTLWVFFSSLITFSMITNQAFKTLYLLKKIRFLNNPKLNSIKIKDMAMTIKLIFSKRDKVQITRKRLQKRL